MKICRLMKKEYKLTWAKLLSIWNCKKFTSKYSKVIGGNQSKSFVQALNQIHVYLLLNFQPTKMKVAYTCNLDWKTHNTIWCRERCQIFRQKPLVSINLCVYCAVPKNLLIINSHVNYTACEKERNQGSEKKRGKSFIHQHVFFCGKIFKYI